MDPDLWDPYLMLLVLLDLDLDPDPFVRGTDPDPSFIE